MGRGRAEAHRTWISISRLVDHLFESIGFELLMPTVLAELETVGVVADLSRQQN